MTIWFADTSIWIALTISEHDHNRVAREWFTSVQDSESVIFCRSTQQSLLRLLTNAAVFGRYGYPPLTNDDAWRAYETILSDDRVTFREDEPDALERWWRRYSQRSTASPKLWMDAYLAAFARAEGCTMVTTDAAFKQFPGLELLLLE